MPGIASLPRVTSHMDHFDEAQRRVALLEAGAMVQADGEGAAESLLEETDVRTPGANQGRGKDFAEVR